MTVRRVAAFALGVALIVLGFAGWHVELGAILVGSIAIGLTSGDWIVELVDAARRNGRRNHAPTVGEAPDRQGDPPAAHPGPAPPT